MAIQTFVADTILTAAQMNALQGNDYNQTVSTKTASYVLVAADKGTKIVMNAGATNTTITVNTSLFSAGDTLTILNISTSGTCTITAGTATVATAGSLALGLNQGGTLYFTSAGVSVFQADGLTATASGVIQVKSVTKTDTFTTTSTSYTDITGLTLSITPTSASNKILCFFNVIASGLVAVNIGGINLVRDSTAIAQASAAGSRILSTSIVPETPASQSSLASNNFLDSPATTSATTYKLQIRSGAAGTIVVNRTNTDTDNNLFFRGTSSLTVMEVSP